MRQLFFRWFFFVGFLYLLCVSGWAIMVVTRLRREHAIALTLLNTIVAQMGLRRAVDKLQSGTLESVARRDDL